MKVVDSLFPYDGILKFNETFLIKIQIENGSDGIAIFQLGDSEKSPRRQLIMKFHLQLNFTQT